MALNFFVFEYDIVSVVAGVFLFDISDDDWPILHELMSASLLKYYCVVRIVQANDGQQFIHLFPFDWSARLYIRQMEDERLALLHRPLGDSNTF